MLKVDLPTNYAARNLDVINNTPEMTSDAKNVTDYLKDVPEKRKAALTKLRKLCKEVLKGYEESMAYGDQLTRKTKALR